MLSFEMFRDENSDVGFVIETGIVKFIHSFMKSYPNNQLKL